MGKYLLSAATNALTLLSSPTQPQWLIWFQVLQLKTRIRIYIYKFNAHELKMATLLCSPAVMLEVEGATFELQCVQGTCVGVGAVIVHHKTALYWSII